VPEPDAMQRNATKSTDKSARKQADEKGKPKKGKPKEDEPGQIGSIVQLVKDYARQETLGPLRGAGRWLAFGVIGAFLLGFAAIFLVLGALRLMQNEFGRSFRGQWMHVLPYVIAFGVAVVVLVVAVTRIGKSTLQKEEN
jgi:cytochrome c biogenesis protein CcdA